MKLLLQRAATWLSAILALAVVLVAGAAAPIVVGRPMPQGFYRDSEVRQTSSGLKVLSVDVGAHTDLVAGRDSTRTFPTFRASGGYLIDPPTVWLEGSTLWVGCERGPLMDLIDPCQLHVELAVPKGVSLDVHVAPGGYFDASDAVAIKAISRG